ncbi:hypothetical protein HJD18_00665 [Thermoleophilia bacterium SCSIO 60948]|nr:hypothetical protein HJD18_00665 [Thermoleophilia bacterium SCSIO 60948]
MADEDQGGEALERRRANARAQAAARTGVGSPSDDPAESAKAPGACEAPELTPPADRSRLAAAAPAVLLLAISLTLAALAVLRDDPQADQVAASARGATLVSASAIRTEPAADQPRRALDPPLPAATAIRDAEDWARTRGEDVAFAVVDSEGELEGVHEDERFICASIVKSMLLVAELRRLAAEGSPLDPETAALLTAMITYSDNDAADAIYARVGDEGMAEVADLYGMKRLQLNGYWAASFVTAADMARMFSDLERPIPPEHREFALGLLGSVIPEQSWGVPAAAKTSREGWQVRFKGGWRPTDTGWLANQAAELRDGDETLAIAVMTDGQPDFAYATDTVEGIAARLLAEPSSGRKKRQR